MNVLRCKKCDTAIYIKKDNGKIIKSRLVLTDDKGRILAKCKKCREIIVLPLRAANTRDL